MPNYKDFELDLQKDKQKNTGSYPDSQKTVTQYDCRSLYGSGSCRACCCE